MNRSLACGRIAAVLLAALPWGAAGESISTYAGGGNGGPATSAVITPLGVAIDLNGDVLIGDVSRGRIRKVTLSTGLINTVAGDGPGPLPGDGEGAVGALLSSPTGIAVDAGGNWYIAERSGHRVRKVTAATGIITTVAGNGVATFAGDGGAATSASLSSPVAVALDSAGNVYIADSNNNRIRKVTVATGVITTVAGSGATAFSGDGFAATGAGIWAPFGVAVASNGDILVADTNHARLRKVNASSGIITTIAGTGSASSSGNGASATAAALIPNSIAIDSNGDIYINDAGVGQIRKITATSGNISAVAGQGGGGFSGDGGPATAARFNNIWSIALDAAGNVYICDASNGRVRRVDKASGNIATIAGNGLSFAGDGVPATQTDLNNAIGVAVDAAGNLFIADLGNYRIRKVAPGGVISTIAGNGTQGSAGDGGPAVSATVNSVRGTVVDANGNLYFSDSASHTVRRINASNGTIEKIAGNGSAGFGGDGSAATAAQLDSPLGLAVDASGNLYIADQRNQRIRKVSGGTITTVAGNGTPAFAGDGGAATSASLWTPTGVAVDADGNLYVSDFRNARIRKITSTTGVITTIAGNGTTAYSGDGGAATGASFSGPIAIALDASRNVYVADQNDDHVRKITAATGIITTIAGGATRGFTGDGGSALGAKLGGPAAIAVDAGGAVYISDQLSNRIRKLVASAPYAPAIGIANPGVGQAAIAFTAGGDGGSAITSFTATCNPGALAASAPASPIMVSGMSDGTPYTCSVTATNALGTSAASSVVSFTPGQAPSFMSANGVTVTYGVAFTFSFGASGSPAPAFSITGALPAGVAFDAGAGTLSGTATQAAWFPLTVTAANGIAPDAMQTFTLQVDPSGQAIAFGALPNRKVGASFTISASASSGLTVAFSSSTPSSCSIAGNTVTIAAAGTCTIHADQAGNANYLAAPTASRSFAVVNLPALHGGDFNGDGKADMLWSNIASGATWVWHMDGTAFISDTFIAQVDPSWKLQGVADFNGDGKNDIVWRNTTTGDTFAWYMDGATLVSDAFLFNLPPEWVIQGVADFNADGHPDFLLRNVSSGLAFAWFFNNASPIGDQFLFGIDPSWKVEAVADFSGDGQPDLLFRSMTSGLAFVWNTTYGGGSLALGSASEPLFSIDPSWEIAQAANWNDDASPDLLFRNASTGVVFVWYVNGVALGGSEYMTQIDPAWEIVPRR